MTYPASRKTQPQKSVSDERRSMLGNRPTRKGAKEPALENRREAASLKAWKCRGGNGMDAGMGAVGGVVPNSDAEHV